MVDLPVLHDFSDVGVKKYASKLLMRPDEQKSGQPRYVVIKQLGPFYIDRAMDDALFVSRMVTGIISK